MKKRIASILLVICMLITLMPIGAMAASAFTDMPKDYSTGALEAAVANGLMNGEAGKIMPNDNLKRAEMAAIIVRAFGAVTAAPLTGFTDVPATAWYYGDMGKAVQMKVFSGDGTLLTPEAPITREQAFAVLARAMKLTDGTAADLAAFGDRAAVSAWAVGTTAAMVKSGFVNGSNGNLNPLNNISRKDFAVLMDNLVKTYIKTAGTVTTVAAGSVMVSAPGVTLSNLTIKGNLIIGDGVAEGNVTLDNVKVEGTTIVRGGGVNSIIIKGKSVLGTIIVAKVSGNVRVSVESGATVSLIQVAPEAANATVAVGTGATVNKVSTASQGTKITGSGTVKEVVAEAGAKDTAVTTPGTSVKADTGATGTTAGGKPVAGGSTVISKPETGGGGGYVPSVPASEIAGITAIKSVIIGAPELEKYDVTFTKSGNTFTADGPLAKVIGWTEFSSIADQQNGYYVSFKIPLTDAQKTSMTAAKAGNIFWLDSNFAASNGTHVGKENIYKDTDITLFDGQTGGWFINVVRLIKDEAALANASFNFSIDYDGSNNNGFTKTTYRVDLSHVVLLPEGVSGMTAMPTTKIALNTTGSAGGTNPLTGLEVTTNYAAALSGAGITYDASNYTLNVNTKTLKTWLDDNKTNGVALAGLMNKDNQKIWAGLKYEAPGDQTHVRVAWDSAAGIKDKEARPAAKWIDFNELGTIQDNKTTLDMASLLLKKSYDQTMYMLWYADAAATTPTAMTKATVHVKMNVPVTYDGTTIDTAATTPYGEAITLPTAPTLADNLFAGWYTDEELTIPFDASKPVNVTELNLFAKWEKVTELTSAVQQQTDLTYISYTLKNGTADFKLGSPEITKIGILKDGEMKIMEVVEHTAKNCPAEFGTATAGKVCMVLTSTDAHDMALTVSKTATGTWYFWTAAGCFSFPLPTVPAPPAA